MINSAGNLLDDHIEVNVVHVKAVGLVDEASPNLFEVDWLAGAVSLDNVLDRIFYGRSRVTSF